MVKLLVGVFEVQVLFRSIYANYAKDAKGDFKRLKVKDINMKRCLSQTVTHVSEEVTGPIAPADDIIDHVSDIQRTETTSTTSNLTEDELYEIPLAFNKEGSVFADDQASIKIHSTSIFNRFRRRSPSVGSWAGGLNWNGDNELISM